jgi:hypothetical protein
MNIVIFTLLKKVNVMYLLKININLEIKRNQSDYLKMVITLVKWVLSIE